MHRRVDGIYLIRYGIRYKIYTPYSVINFSGLVEDGIDTVIHKGHEFLIVFFRHRTESEVNVLKMKNFFGVIIQSDKVLNIFQLFFMF